MADEGAFGSASDHALRDPREPQTHDSGWPAFSDPRLERFLRTYLDFGPSPRVPLRADIDPIKLGPLLTHVWLYRYDAHQDRTKLAKILDESAAALEKFGTNFLSGSASFWVDIHDIRRRDQAEQDRADISERAEKAFKAKDWNRAIEHLEKLDSRSNLEEARLARARKMIE